MKMDDLISRRKAIQWVKAECNPYGQPTLDYESGIKVIEHLERMPSAQPEIIRCKDCKWHEDDFCTNFNVLGFEGYDYCSLGERRED